MASDTGLYDDGRQYDLIYPPSGDDGGEVCFWRAQAARWGDPVLELACGTGRLALPLARDGRRVTGIDNAPGMLREARRKAAAHGLSVEWVQGDIRAFDLGRRFAFVFLAHNAVCHLLTRPDFDACMAAVRRHLEPQGRFVVDVFVPGLESLLPRPGQRLAFGEFDDPRGSGHVAVTHSYVYEADTQITRNTLHYRWPDGTETQAPLDMRMYFPQELDARLEACGLAIERKMGDVDGSAFVASSTRQLVLCRAAV